MATVLLAARQTDDGKTVVITDTTEWADTANTGVTHVTITITKPDATEVVAIDQDMTQPCLQSDLVFEINATDLGYTDEVYIDQFYAAEVEYTTSPASDAVTFQFLLDWNTKLYNYQLAKEISYSIENQQFKYNKAIEKSMVFDVLKRGLQYSASVEQVAKGKDILEIIDKFKLIQI